MTISDTKAFFKPLRKSVTVELRQVDAFERFTSQIGSWWPIEKYSLSRGRAVRIDFESRVGGRIFEVQDNGNTFNCGRVLVWQPPHRVVMAWHPGMPPDAAQEVEVRFQQREKGTLVEVEHRGWTKVGNVARMASHADDMAFLDLLLARWGDAGPLLAAFPLLARGTPISEDEIAGASGVAVEEVEEALGTARCQRDATGHVTDLYGLTLAPTPHRLEIGTETLFSCCALWAHVIPKLVGTNVRIESVDPIRREIIRLTISPAGVESVHPHRSVATLAIATKDEINPDVGAVFCPRIRHFATRDDAIEFANGKACQVVELAQLQWAADLLYHGIGNIVAQ